MEVLIQSNSMGHSQAQTLEQWNREFGINKRKMYYPQAKSIGV